MIEKNLYTINMGALFYALNANRTKQGLIEIEHALIASKLGILFALKTNAYVNFKCEIIELNDAQLIALHEIFEQHFNAGMIEEIRTLVIIQESQPEKVDIHHLTPSSRTRNTGFFSKIKGFLKMRPEVQESLA